MLSRGLLLPIQSAFQDGSNDRTDCQCGLRLEALPGAGFEGCGALCVIKWLVATSSLFQRNRGLAVCFGCKGAKSCSGSFPDGGGGEELGKPPPIRYRRLTSLYVESYSSPVRFRNPSRWAVHRKLVSACDACTMQTVVKVSTRPKSAGCGTFP